MDDLLFVGLNFAVMGVAFAYIRLCVRIVGEVEPANKQIGNADVGRLV